MGVAAHEGMRCRVVGIKLEPDASSEGGAEHEQAQRGQPLDGLFLDEIQARTRCTAHRESGADDCLGDLSHDLGGRSELRVHDLSRCAVNGGAICARALAGYEIECVLWGEWKVFGVHLVAAFVFGRNSVHQSFTPRSRHRCSSAVGETR